MKHDFIKIIGNTPIVELKRYSSNSKIKIYAKLEGFNPTGSIKDRIAYFMIKQAQISGQLKPQMELIEATTGNTGISLAAVSSVFGYQFTAVMPTDVSIERRKLIQSYGANLILTKSGSDITITKGIVKKYPNKYYFIDQFNNPNNVRANYHTLGGEIIKQIPKITHFVAGIGTSGTLIGVAKRLKEYKPEIKIIGLNPRPSTKIQGLRNLETYKPLIFDKKYVDELIYIKNSGVAFELMKDLAKNQGLSVGISSGIALWGAIKIAKQIKQGVIVIIFPDRGDRYLSLL